MLPLQKKHPHHRDKLVAFEPIEHIYTISRSKPEEAPTSVTGFAKGYFKQFDQNAIVDKYFERWRSDSTSKYYNTISSVMEHGGDLDSAKSAILKLWSTNSAQASRDGTKMHADAELLCNGMCTDQSAEMDMLSKWLKDYQPHMKWKPVRTEWMLWWELERDDATSPILLAGTLDLLMWSETEDVYGLFDFKRTNPKPKVSGGTQNLLGPHTHPRYHPGYAKSPLSEVENSDFGKYTMQLNILSKMLRERYGIDVMDKMYLLQLHSDLEGVHCVKVQMLPDATNSLFNIEAEQLRVLHASRR